MTKNRKGKLTMTVMDKVKQRVDAGQVEGEKTKPGQPPQPESEDPQTADEQLPDEDPKQEEPEHSEPSPPELIYRDIQVPLEDVDRPSFQVHVDLRISGGQAAALRKLAAGLDAKRATLSNGKRCVGINDAIRWLVDQIA